VFYLAPPDSPRKNEKVLSFFIKTFGLPNDIKHLPEVMALINNELVLRVKTLKDKGHTKEFQSMEINERLPTNSIPELRTIVEEVENVKKGSEDNKQSRYNTLVAAREVFRDSKTQMTKHSTSYIQMSDAYWQVCYIKSTI
jgi:hypothetical protein